MPSLEPGSRVLVLATGALGERLSGPEIRAVRLAGVLAAEHEVTLMAPSAERGERDGLPVLPFSRRRLLREARRHDAVMAAVVPPFVLAMKRQLGIVAISDQYDPVELEVGTLEHRGARRARATARAARRLQLRCADLVLCASASQRALLEDEIARIGDAARPPLCTVPFGIDPPPPDRDGNPLRERFPQIGAEDKIVLWWGSLWRWLDPETAIRAFASIADRPDVKLVFTSGPPPNGDMQRHSVATAARQLAADLDLLGRTVFFLDEWVPYERRGDYLQEADLGLTLHRDTEEAPLAARARYMDYLWAGLPCVLGRGDETADRFEASGFATLVKPDAPSQVAGAILDLLEPATQAGATVAGGRLADELRWPHLAAPLLTALRELGEAPEAGGLAGTTSYYLRRLRDRMPLSSQRRLGQGTR